MAKGSNRAGRIRLKGETDMYNKVEETLHDLQELGFDLNDMKSRGIGTVDINKYEDLLNVHIDMVRQINQMGVNAGFIK